MEDVIEIYGLPLNEKNPVVCFDESPFQLLREVREPMPGSPGRPRREDCEYERCGVAEVSDDLPASRWVAQMSGDGASQKSRFCSRVPRA